MVRPERVSLPRSVGVLTAPLDWEGFHAGSRRRAFAYFFNLTVMLHELGEHERELAEVRRGQRLHPEISWLYDQEAKSLAALGRLDEMERVVGERLSLASAGQRGNLFLYLGLELRAHGRREASATILAQGLEALQGCSPEEAKTQETRAELGLLLRLAGRLDEARSTGCTRRPSTSARPGNCAGPSLVRRGGSPPPTAKTPSADHSRGAGAM